MASKVDASSSKSQQQRESPQQNNQQGKKKFVDGCRRFVLWFKTVFFIRKEYVRGDTCRFIWQKVPEVKLIFVYYRIAHMLANLVILTISFFHISTPYRERFCAQERAVICLGPSGARMQYEWLFFATSWGLVTNLTQSLWGLVLTLNLYLRQRRARKMVKDIESPADAIARRSAHDPKSPQVRDSKSPSNNLEGAEPKDAGPVKPQSFPTGSKAPESVVPKKPQDLKTSTFKDSSKPTTGPDNPKSVLTNAKQGKKPRDAQSPSPVPESGAGPSATKEHKIFSKTGFYWGLHTYSVCSTLLIDSVYWTIIWPNLSTWPSLLLIQVDEHAFNFPLMVADYCLVAFPVTLSHLWFTTTISVLYVVVNCIYHFAGGLNDDRTRHYLYTYMDWKKPGVALLFGTAITVTTSLYLLVLLVIDHYKFKLRPKALSTTLK